MDNITLSGLAFLPFVAIFYVCYLLSKPATKVTHAQAMGRVNYSELGMTQ